MFIVWQGLLMTQGQKPELSSEGFYQFVLFTIMMGASVGSLPDLYASIQKAIGSTENLMNVINETTEIEVNEGNSRPQIEGKIKFENVSFSYPQRADIEVLKGVSFEVDKNQTLALVGASGSGKSTISNLLLKFYQPDSGTICIDNSKTSDFELTYLREHMAIVPQEVLLFSGTILENIRFGKPSATIEEVQEAAKKANAWEFISTFPEQLETEVGDRGIQLSGGQKQRIAIARAILKNPTILILDEATSALDSESERLVQEALEKLMEGRTSIVIAHRLSTIRNADQILVMQQGQIIERGKHEELIAQKGVYSELVQLQQMNSVK